MERGKTSRFIANSPLLGYSPQTEKCYLRESPKVNSVLGRWAQVAGRRLVYSGVGVLLSAPFLVASVHASEASLRVAFVYNFLKFIEWPAKAKQPLSLCALGAQGITRDALTLVEKKSHEQRLTRVVYLDRQRDIELLLNDCQMLYRPEGNGRLSLPAELPPGVLLVADEPDPSDTRVAIALRRTADNRIEFSVNEAAIARAGVQVSSQLLKLATKPSGHN